MPRVTLVRYTTRPEMTQENEALTRAVFDALRAARPAEVGYSVFREGDAFTHLFVNWADDNADALTELPAFKAFQSGSAERMTAPPEVIRLNPRLLEAFGFTA
jgi:quinol monooxygenase YgiN